MKVLIEADGDRILGFAAFGAEAGEIVPVVQLAMSAGLPYTALSDSILTHPTIAERLVSLLSAVPARA
jgi:pyruvate/2-oxoglutarate dehydrogenase complex dihydrolipoamide dehydrogenase (E3) component